MSFLLVPMRPLLAVPTSEWMGVLGLGWRYALRPASPSLCGSCSAHCMTHVCTGVRIVSLGVGVGPAWISGAGASCVQPWERVGTAGFWAMLKLTASHDFCPPE